MVLGEYTHIFQPQPSVLDCIVSTCQNATSYHSRWSKSDANSSSYGVWRWKIVKKHVFRQMLLLLWGATLSCRSQSIKNKKLHLIALKMKQIGPNLAELSMFYHHNPPTPPQPHTCTWNMKPEHNIWSPVMKPKHEIWSPLMKTTNEARTWNKKPTDEDQTWWSPNMKYEDH